MKNFNFQEQLLLWEKNQILLQKKYADTPPGFSTPEAQKAAQEAWESAYALYLENGCYKVNDLPLPSSLAPLIGRETELESIRKMLAVSHTVFLYGIGGIGKTAIALQYMEDHRHTYDHILYSLTHKGILQGFPAVTLFLTFDHITNLVISVAAAGIFQTIRSDDKQSLFRHICNGYAVMNNLYFVVKQHLIQFIYIYGLLKCA